MKDKIDHRFTAIFAFKKGYNIENKHTMNPYFYFRLIPKLFHFFDLLGQKNPEQPSQHLAHFRFEDYRKDKLVHLGSLRSYQLKIIKVWKKEIELR